MYNEQQDTKLHNIILRLGGFHTWMSFMVSIDLIMEDSGIGYLWWKIYADSTLSDMVSSKAYVGVTRGHMQGTMPSNTIMTSMVLITAIYHFFQELNCQIYMTQRQLHLTWKYHKCLSASLLQTSQCEYLEYERNKSILQLKEAARFYNNLRVGKLITNAVPSPPLQKISEIRWHLPPPTHIAPAPPPHPFPISGKIAKKTYILFVTLTVSPQILSSSKCWWEASRPLVG